MTRRHSPNSEAGFSRFGSWPTLIPNSVLNPFKCRPNISTVMLIFISAEGINGLKELFVKLELSKIKKRWLRGVKMPKILVQLRCQLGRCLGEVGPSCTLS